jgi:flagella basal body P-ring formation protein FlgA
MGWRWTGRAGWAGRLASLFCTVLCLYGSAAPAAASSQQAIGIDLQPAMADWRLRIEALVRQEAAGLPGELSIHIEDRPLAQRPACSELAVVKPAGFRLRPRMTIGLRCAAPQRWSTYVEVQARVSGRYPVAAQTLRAGEPLVASAYVWREGDLLALPNDVLLDDKLLSGYSTRQRIAAGQPLRAGSLRSADAVLRGAPVKLTLQGKGFTVSRDGAVALEEGAPGSTVSVRTSSGQVVSGVVRGAAWVELGLP